MSAVSPAGRSRDCASLHGVPIDPAPFLSTVILASAALVAIVGGLLVARFVTLDSDEQSSRRVIADAEGRLSMARRRSEGARRSLFVWIADNFIGERDVRDAIGEGVVDLAELRQLAECDLSDGELGQVVAEVADEFARAREVLASTGWAPLIEESEYDWTKFRSAASDLPELRWPAVWRDVFEEIAARQAEDDAARRRVEREALRRRFPVAAAMMNTPDFTRFTLPGTIAIQARSDLGAISARRYDELLAADERAWQRVEDYEDELRRLREAHTEIVRPDARLWWGMAIVVAFAIVGVALPAWLMVYGPPDLSRVRWVLYPFTGGLAALLVYIVLYLVQLTRRRTSGRNAGDGQA